MFEIILTQIEVRQRVALQGEETWLLTKTENQTRRRMMDVRASHVVAGPSPSIRIECSIEGIEVASRLLEVTQLFRAQLPIQHSRIIHNNAYPLCEP